MSDHLATARQYVGYAESLYRHGGDDEIAAGRLAAGIAQAHAAIASADAAELMEQLIAHWRQAVPDPVRQVPCPACGQLVEPTADGTLPGHQIQQGPGRRPMCRFRGKVVLPEAGEPR